MTENPRPASARDHDDHELIDAAIADADMSAVPGSAGGALQTDIGTKDDIAQAVTDPGGTTRPEKADDIAANQAYDSDRSGAHK